MKAINETVRAMAHSGIREIVNLAIELPDVKRLEIGQPSFVTPAHIISAAFQAAREGFTGYTASAGFLSLRELLVKKLERVNHIQTSPDNIVITVGAVGGIASALLALCERGAGIMVPDPGWPNYEMIAQCIGGRIIRYPCSPQRGFLPSLHALESLIKEHSPRVLILNSPSNPSGVVFPPELVQELVELANRNDVWVIGDEVYDELVFEGEHTSPKRFDREGRVISVFSFSKTYAMTGWRLGYVVAPTEVAGEIQKLQEPFVSCAPSISQKAGEAALTGPQDCVEEMRTTYHHRRDLVIDILRDYGMYAYTPQGAFYVLLDVSEAGMDSRTFALELLKEKGVAVAPGNAFGEVARDYVRICFAAQDAALIDGLERLRVFVKEKSQREPAGVHKT